MLVLLHIPATTSVLLLVEAIAKACCPARFTVCVDDVQVMHPSKLPALHEGSRIEIEPVED